MTWSYILCLGLLMILVLEFWKNLEWFYYNVYFCKSLYFPAKMSKMSPKYSSYRKHDLDLYFASRLTDYVSFGILTKA